MFHLPRIRVLLGAHAPWQEDGEAADFEEEVQGLAVEPEGLAAEEPEPAAEGTCGDAQAEISWLLQLLRSDRELKTSVALLEREPSDYLPGAEPAKPTQKLQLDWIRTDVEDAGYFNPTHCGKALLRTGPMETLLQITNASRPLLRDRSEEPGAGKPHAGICEGGTGQPVSLP